MRYRAFGLSGAWLVRGSVRQPTPQTRKQKNDRIHVADLHPFANPDQIENLGIPNFSCRFHTPASPAAAWIPSHWLYASLTFSCHAVCMQYENPILFSPLIRQLRKRTCVAWELGFELHWTSRQREKKNLRGTAYDSFACPSLPVLPSCDPVQRPCTTLSGEKDAVPCREKGGWGPLFLGWRMQYSCLHASFSRAK